MLAIPPGIRTEMPRPLPAVEVIYPSEQATLCLMESHRVDP